MLGLEELVIRNEQQAQKQAALRAEINRDCARALQLLQDARTPQQSAEALEIGLAVLRKARGTVRRDSQDFYDRIPE
jgi:hypothetical protein